jgi:beta-glucosidase
LTFTVSAEDMSIIDAAGRRVVLPGIVDLWIGGGQPGGARPAAGAGVQVAVSGRHAVAPF